MIQTGPVFADVVRQLRKAYASNGKYPDKLYLSKERYDALSAELEPPLTGLRIWGVPILVEDVL